MVSRRGPSNTGAIVCILTDRFKVPNNWVSHISFATILGFAGLVLALKDGRFRNLKLFSARDEDSGDDSVHVPGLQNIGNNCFLNVILQALASCKDFRSFLQWVIEDARDTVAGELDQQFPLTFALSALLQELCVVGRRRSVSNPREVMLALTDYTRNFNLTSQQDAAEALLHLISSLQEEIVFCYRPIQSCNLSDVLFSRNLRMLAPTEGLHGLLELKRWHKHLRGPFDGILGSTLMCRTCSSQISLEFQFFHTLPLSPLLHSGGSNIVCYARCLDALWRIA
ncbi:ubiquitin carboxyl-terminal hydrolase 27 isoform X2 [Capsella rubella]|uniref:ubiquitin carboxyl-terminal hydrolase 27 isoform X2 n=1 Tax=Capsella rubella TaxID=81985 RepID=UPI000CD4E00A|nr:ubiquitin carboxyl-terminal hydrolase 27 isoform X2 [Capsella rubella]